MQTSKNAVTTIAVLVFCATISAPKYVHGQDDVAQLKEQLATQQKQMEEFRTALREQRELLEQVLRAVGSKGIAVAALPADKNLGEPTGSDHPATSTKPEETVPVSELEVVKGELEAVANSVAETNLRVTKLDKETKSSVLAGWTGSHPYIRSKDGNFEMEFGGRLQLDHRAYTGTANPSNTFLIRRARLEAGGRLFKHYEYKVQADFAETNARLLRDGYLNINYTPALQMQFGQFKAPFSQEELQSSKYIDFVERSSVNSLAPARSPGVMVHGTLANGVFEYAAGGFNARKELQVNTAGTPEAYVRLRFTPFRDSGPAPLRDFSFGGAFADGRHRNDLSFAGVTASRSTLFFTPVPVNGEIVRANAEFWWRYKSFSVRGEYDQTNQARENLKGDGINLPGVIGKGMVFQATYLLTGEAKTDTGITPKKNFLGGERGLGAWELAFRYENLQMHDSANPNRAEAYTFGVNWWMTKFVRYQSNFILEQFKDPLRTPTPGDTDHFGYLSRIQVIF